MVQNMLKRWSGNFQTVLWPLMLALGLAAVIGCSSGGGDSAGFLSSGSPRVYAGDATLTCANETDMIACRGIKYAQAQRFAASQLVELTGSIDATEFGSACVQDDGTGSEDCLFLNVFFPKGTNLGDDLPVMVWIHGGALIQGSGSVPGYDLPALVKSGVIVVTINYRLNAFGFLPHPALEDPTGNFGLKDQVKALEWVQAHIADFGGNPDNVTIFGESAGGHSVLSLLVSSVRNDGLFHKAIVQSGSYSPTQTPLATVGYYGLGLAFAPVGATPGSGPCSAYTDYADIRTCLRNLTVQQVMDAQKASLAWSWISPVYAASTFLPKNISTALTDGDVPNVPVMIGSNLNEGSLFTGLFMPGYGNFASLGNLEAGVTTLLVADPRAYDRNAVASSYTDWAVATYGANDNRYRNAHSMVFTDATFSCNALGHAATLATHHPTSTYSYWFTDNDAPINPTYAALSALSPYFNLGEWGLGASHSFEIQYIFGTVQDHANVTTAQTNLSNRMIAYWTNFAKNGAPGNGWTAYNGANIRNLNPAGDSDASAAAFATAHYCGCWLDPGSASCWPVAP